MAHKQLSTVERNLMQQDAQRRQREMRRRAQKPSPPPPLPPPEPAPAAPESVGQSRETPLNSLLAGLDRDMILLLALLFVLWREGEDYKLLAALAYVIL